MNKIILSLIGLVFSSSFFSQNFTQANEPVIGETKSLFICDSFAVNYAGITGSGVTWDYGNLPAYYGLTKTIDVLNATTTPFAADFPVSTAATRLENFTYTFIKSTATERSSDGYVLEGTDIGDVKAKFSSDAQMLMNYPSAVGASIVDSFAGTLSFVYSGIPQNPACTGISYATYDGIGSLVQPNGVTLTNISRYNFSDTLWTTIPVIGAAQIVRSQYEYYDLSATNHLPVFLHISAKLLSAFPDPLIDATVVLSEVSGPTTASIGENEFVNVKVYPNPAKDILSIDNLPSNASVSLMDLSGRTVSILNTNANSFDVSSLSKGVYILKIKSVNNSITQNVIIE